MLPGRVDLSGSTVPGRSQQLTVDGGIIMEKVMLTVEEVAQRWGVKPRTIYAMISDGKIKALRVGRLVRISRSHIEFLEGSGQRHVG